MPQMWRMVVFRIPVPSVRETVFATYGNHGWNLYGRQWLVSIARKSMSCDDYDISMLSGLTLSMSRELAKRVDMNRRRAMVCGMKYKICASCGKALPATAEYFRPDGRKCANGQPIRDGLRAACRDCMRLRDQAYYAAHAEARRDYQRKHLREGDTRRKRREQQRRRMELPVNRIKNNLFRRLNHAVACAVKHAPTYELVGCTPDRLKAHLEAAFLPGMTWENYGKGGWHIDHVVPCAAFDLTKESEQRKCFHYSNLQPLWGSDNLSKGKKVASRAPCVCSACQRCGGRLDKQGMCTDETCPFDRHQQQCGKGWVGHPELRDRAEELCKCRPNA